MPNVTATDTAARDPNPARTPTAADESTTPLCAALVATAVPVVVPVEVELPLDKVNDSGPAVTVTVCAGGWEVMNAVAVTVGLVDPVSELERKTIGLANLCNGPALSSHVPMYGDCSCTRGACRGCGG